MGDRIAALFLPWLTGCMESATPEVLRLFPTFVWRRQLGPRDAALLKHDLLGKLGELRGGAPRLSAGGAWQSAHRLHELPEFMALTGHIEAGVRDVLTFLKIGVGGGVGGFRITGCWANVLAPGAAHAMHSHPNNFLSGVYYVSIPQGANTIHFHDPRPQTGVMRPPVTGLTAYNTDLAAVTVSEGTLLLFPAWLPHSVPANASTAERISISFNVMFTAYDEAISPPLWGGA